MTLPVLVSVSHAGTGMPPEVADLVCLSQADVVKDGDEQAADVYHPLRPLVSGFVSTDIARAFVDVNRREDDFRKDGVVKTHTCWDVPVYRRAPDEPLIAALLQRYYRPYHRRLSILAHAGGARVGVDCHTMAAVAPPVAPDAGRGRPAACVSDAGGTCDPSWTRRLAVELEVALGAEVRINDPFGGGYIIRRHAAEMPWLQLEVSRGDFMGAAQKRDAVRNALTAWCRRVFGVAGEG